MFAIPAFQSLSSKSLKSSFKKRSGSDLDALPNDANPSTSKPRKRKRFHPAESNAAPPSDIPAEDIGHLWTTIVEGKPDASSQPPHLAASLNPQKASRKTGKDKVEEKSHHEPDCQSLEVKRKRRNRKTDHEEQSTVTTITNDKIKSVRQSENGHDSNHAITTAVALPVGAAVGPTPGTPLSKTPTLTPLQEKMRQKLSGARFRHLNQLLYTTPSQDSLTLFASQPEMFRDYHAGFRQQVESWPENPVDIYIKRLFTRGKLRDSGPRGGGKSYRSKNLPTTGVSLANATPLGTNGFQDALEAFPLPRARDGFTTVVDLGCGEAALAKAITSAKPRPKIKVQSYDLNSPGPLVTVADIANLPLQSSSVDVAIFCLALMGTNWPKMIEEAVRVVRNGGELWIAEIKSRFARTKTPQKGDAADAGRDNKRGKGKKGAAKGIKDDTDPADAFVEERDGNVDPNKWAAGEQSFIEALARRGLRLKSRNGTNKMFVLLDFEKVGGRGEQMFQIPPKPDMHGRVSKKFHTDDKPEVDEASILQPCLYKIR